jgi:transcriptional antiterminator RfaH
MSTPETKNVEWFCLCAQPKHEHIAASHLRNMEDVHVFLPRIRFKRVTRLGTAWVTEALFPGYLFAAFDWQSDFRRVQHANGVRGIVHFGENWPVIPKKTIETLREMIGATGLHTISHEFSPGDQVSITDGSLRGLQAVVSHVMPSRERVAVLMEILGRQTVIELTATSIIKKGDKRTGLFEELG